MLHQNSALPSFIHFVVKFECNWRRNVRWRLTQKEWWRKLVVSFVEMFFWVNAREEEAGLHFAVVLYHVPSFLVERSYTQYNFFHVVCQYILYVMITRDDPCSWSWCSHSSFFSCFLMMSFLLSVCLFFLLRDEQEREMAVRRRIDWTVYPSFFSLYCSVAFGSSTSCVCAVLLTLVLSWFSHGSLAAVVLFSLGHT